MLHLFRRHVAACRSKFHTPKRSQECPRKPKCPIHFEGIDGQGRRHKPQGLKDPQSGSGVRDWNRAVEIIREMELPSAAEQTAKPLVGIEQATAAFLAYKSKRSPDVQRKIQLLLKRLQAFFERRGKNAVADIGFTDLVDFRVTWTEAQTTQRRNQELLKQFFGFARKAEFIAKNPAEDLDPLPVDRPKTDPFTREELDRIFAALPRLADEYGRTGGPTAAQTKAFALIMRYTGMAIGDVAKLRKDAVQGHRIRTYRKKTGEDVFASVPPFVIDALQAAPHDSERYFFWSGTGKLHTRTGKWGARLQRLFVLAGVRTVVVERRRRVAGKLLDETERVTVSKATPHMFRHTLARDLLERGTPMEEVAELLGNDMKTVEKYYSKWDVRRQERLEKRLEDFWADDPATHKMQEPQLALVK